MKGGMAGSDGSMRHRKNKRYNNGKQWRQALRLEKEDGGTIAGKEEATASGGRRQCGELGSQ